MTFQEDVSPDGTYQTDVVTIHGTTQGSTNEGGASFLIGDKNDGSTLPYRGLFGFDISDIPAGSIIDSVTLTLFAKGDDSTSVNADATLQLFELIGSFNEDEANYADRNTMSVPVVAWTTQGGDYSSLLSSVVDNPKTMTANEAITLASSTAFVDAAQVALDGSGTIYTLLRIAEEGGNDASRHLFQIHTDDNTVSTSYNPILTVTYTEAVPEPSTIVMILVGAVALLGFVRRQK
jgi:hypothetical protein